jgi:hypothetical protein
MSLQCSNLALYKARKQPFVSRRFYTAVGLQLSIRLSQKLLLIAAGLQLHPETRGIWDREYLPPESLMGVGLRSVVSDFPVLHPESGVGIFRGAFISLSSSLLCSAIGFLWFWLGDPSVPGSAIGCHRLSHPIVFQGFWLGFCSSSQSPPSPPMCSVDFPR